MDSRCRENVPDDWDGVDGYSNPSVLQEQGILVIQGLYNQSIKWEDEYITYQALVGHDMVVDSSADKHQAILGVLRRELDH